MGRFESGMSRAVGPLVSGTFRDGTFSDGTFFMGSRKQYGKVELLSTNEIFIRI